MDPVTKLCNRCEELATYNGIQQLDLEDGVLGGFKHGRFQDILDQASSITPCPLCVVIRDSATDKVDDPSYPVWLRWHRRSFERAGEFGHVTVYLEVNARSINGLGTMCLLAREGETSPSLGVDRPTYVSCASE